MNITCFYYSLKNGAGTEKVLSNLLNYLARKAPDEALTFLGVDSSNSSFFDIDGKVRFETLNLTCGTSRIFDKVLYYLRIIFKTRGYFKNKQHGNNILVCGHPLLAIAAFIATFSFKGRKVSIIACEHFAFSKSSKYAQHLKKLFYRYFTVVTLTEADRAYIARFARKVVCIPNTISSLPQERADINSNILLSVGRLHKQKGYDYLIESLHKIKDRLQGKEVVIVGEDKGEMAALQEMIERYDLSEHVRFVPPTRNIHEWYLKASVYLLPSRFEGLPMVLIEAASFGLPIVAFDCPTGPRDVVDDGKNGYLVPCYNVDLFGQRIIALFQDVEQRRKMSVNARNKAAAFLEESIMPKWDELFRENIKKGS